MNAETIETDSSAAPPRGINPGIRMLVALLNAEGFPTTDSGDGKTHDHPCDREGPYVVIKLPPHRTPHIVEETNAVLGVLSRFGILIGPVGGERPWIQASYDPADYSALIDVSGVDDTMIAPLPAGCSCGPDEECSRCPEVAS